MDHHSHVPIPPDCAALEFPDHVLVPGLINCHTHLELTHLGGGAQHDEPEFVKWIRRVRELKDATSAAAFYEAAVAGVRDCWTRGVTCIAETGSTGAVMRALHDLAGRGIVYQEVFGPDPAKRDASMLELETAVRELNGLSTPQLRLGVSPHAPYTVSAELYEAVTAFAKLERLPLAVHLAESREETALVCDGVGPFADALRARGIAIAAQRGSPVSYLMRLGVLQRGTLCIHCVQIDPADVRLLRESAASVAHCPRSNTAHRHGRAPLRLLLEAGVPVGLGTDSVISVGDLDLWKEADAAAFTGDDALRMLTLAGARALRWDNEIGSLEVGKSADLAVFPSSVFRRPPASSAALLTVVSGRIVHQISGS